MAYLLTVILLLLLLLPIGPLQAREHRGLWMSTAAFCTPGKAQTTVERAAAAHINALYPLVWASGQAWYRSRESRMGSNVPPGFDPLANLLQLAHARGMEVHPWFVSGSAGTVHPGDAADRHPDWLVQPGQRLSQPWYDLGQPAVRDFVARGMIDCLRDYDLDGMHYDYIRFSSQVYCYCGYCQQQMQSRYGLPPLKKDDGRFPLWLTTPGNPLTDPTTAQVLASFEDGAPAVTINRLGSGEVGLINWQVYRYVGPAGDRLTAALLGRFGVSQEKLFQLHTAQTAARLGPSWQPRTAEWLKGLGLPPQRIDDAALAQVPADGTVVLAAQYYIGEQTAAALRDFVRGGGHLLFLEGPTHSMALPALQELTGLKTGAPYFYGLRVIIPAAGQDLIPAAEPCDAAAARLRIDKWVEYRKQCVTDLVRQVREQARQVRPQAKISAAVFFTKAEADGVCQDWYRWLREHLVDTIIPMAYTENNEELQAAIREWQTADPRLERILPGLGIWTSRDGRDVTRPADRVISQIEMCRAAGARGNLLFSVNTLSEGLAAALAAGPWEEVDH